MSIGVKVEEGLVVRLSEKVAKHLGIRERDVGSMSAKGRACAVKFLNLTAYS